MASADALERCQGAAATGCLEQAMRALAEHPPDRLGAQRLLAAACEAELKAACATLDQRFHPPTAMRIPALSPSIQLTGSAVLEFSCRLSSTGQLEACGLSRSRGSTPGFDAQASTTLQATQARAQLAPASLDGTPYETELQLVYRVPGGSTPGAAASSRGPQERPNAAFQINRGEKE